MKTFFIAAFVSIHLCGAAAQASADDASTASGLFFNAIEKRDGAALGKVLGQDFVMISFDGQAIDAATLLEGVSAGYVVVDAATLRGNYTRSYPDTGVVTGFWTVKGSIQGTSFNNQLAYTVVCARQGGAWKVVSVQLTPVM